ncbi:MAG TPA: sulfite exporter TauE/SafE family protein [Actinomycetota bacterium]|nr:sulfite exporter TauE/SafE family protein [Actinomycetota bacterium]
MAVAGAAVGVLFGLFGVGGSALATPVLSLLGVPPLLAIASPLPATLGSAFSGLAGYARRKKVDWRVARLSIAGGLPAAIVGSLLSDVVGGRRLLIASGVVLAVVGIRVLRPLDDAAVARAEKRRKSGWLVVFAVAGVGFLTGLLANGGGFLLVPLFLLVLGLSMPESTGTSLAVIAALAVPTLITHTSLGHVAWPVAAAFAMGSIPASFVGAELAHRIDPSRLKKAFGWMLILFAVYFLLRQMG